MSSLRHVTTENWGVAPHNRWSFQHVQELFPTCRLARDPSAAPVLPTKPQDIMQLSFEAADGASTSICEFLAEACCDAFLVVHNGRVIAEHYFNGMTARSHHLLNSVTKSFVGMLAGTRTPRTLLDYARSLDGQEMENGSRFQYRTVCANVLGMVLERAMGARLATLLETEIWSRLAAQHDATIVVDPLGFPYVGAGMNACARDLANFGLMMINDGAFNGRQVVPADWIADTVKGDSTSKECFAKGAYGDDAAGWHYRNQVWITGSDPAVMLAIGIHGQYVYMDKGRDLVIVMLSSQPQPFDEAVDLNTIAAMSAIGSRLEATSNRADRKFKPHPG